MSTRFSKSYKGQTEGHRDIPPVSEGKSVNPSHTMIDSGRMKKMDLYIFIVLNVQEGKRVKTETF